MATSVKEKVQTELDEARTLVLGAVVLLGFEYRAVFEPRFDAMPEWAKLSKVVSLGVMILAFCLMVMPAAYHRIVASGEDTEDVNRFTSGALEAALSFFAVGLGIDAAFASRRVLETVPALVVGVATASIAAGLWYGYAHAARRRPPPPPWRSEVHETRVEEKVKHVLTEARMVLPGAQALLGFQFSVTLMDSFDEVPRALKLVHLAGLGAIVLSIVLLMTPAAYHRVVERGEATEHFHRLAGRLVLAAMIPLTLGICADLLVVTYRVTGSGTIAGAAAAGAAVVVLGMWFGVTTLIRRGDRTSRKRRAPPRAGCDATR